MLYLTLAAAPRADERAHAYDVDDGADGEPASRIAGSDLRLSNSQIDAAARAIEEYTLIRHVSAGEREFMRVSNSREREHLFNAAGIFSL